MEKLIVLSITYIFFFRTESNIYIFFFLFFADFYFRFFFPKNLKQNLLKEGNKFFSVYVYGEVLKQTFQLAILTNQK